MRWRASERTARFGGRELEASLALSRPLAAISPSFVLVSPEKTATRERASEQSKSLQLARRQKEGRAALGIPECSEGYIGKRQT